ncbi:hypothetical protein M1N16_08725 [Nitrospinaceae bacterium]|nr:hypothetical protein [Nitrospinaceae bacterium]
MATKRSTKKVKSKPKTKSKTKSKTKPKKKPFVRKPYELSVKELGKKTDKFVTNFCVGLMAILEMDGLTISDAKFTSYALNVLLYGDSIYTPTTSPYWHEYWKMLEVHPMARDEIKMQSNEEVFDEPFVFIHKSHLLSAHRDLVSGGAVGKFKKELQKMKTSLEECTYE